MSEELKKRTEKVFKLFNHLRKLLKDRYSCNQNFIEIEDLNYTIRVLKNEEIIVFYYFGEEVAILSKDKIKIKKEHENAVKEWLVALTTFEFKRYKIKK